MSVSQSSPARSFLDPDSALKVLSLDPFNAETRLRCLDDDVTPVPKFYKRNHFSMPDIDAAGYRLSIEGAVENPLQISYDDIRSLPQVTLAVTLECAGNGRSAFSPEVGGEPWEFGAVGTAEWTGTSLSRVLHQALVKPEAVEVVTEGADHGVEACAQMSYSRSLSLSEALHPDTLLVWSMNRSALTPEHGFPIRLLVPGWYGMASVKWLTRIKVIEESFRGFFQADRYVFEPPEGGSAAPLRHMKVRSIIVRPSNNDRLVGRNLLVQGYAWSGEAPVVTVEVSLDGGSTWDDANLHPSIGNCAWRRWDYERSHQPGQFTLMSRATDEAGNRQPMIAKWNQLGYANNSIHVVTVVVDS